MPVVQTFARGGHHPDYLALKKSSEIERGQFEVAMKKQLELVSHAMIRGQNLPVFGDSDFSLSYGHLMALRMANIKKTKENRRQSRRPDSASSSSSTSSASSVFESNFGRVDIGRLILDHVTLRDMKTLAGVSRTCRAMISIYQGCWDLGQMSFGLCDMNMGDKASVQHLIDTPGLAIWAHGRGDWDTKRTRNPVDPTIEFASDIALVGHDTASFNLLFSALSLSQGNPLERVSDHAKNLDIPNDLLPNLLQMHSNAVRRFLKMENEDKSNDIYCRWSRIQPLLVSFADHGQHIRRVYLDKIPFMDLRVLTVALENLPMLRDLTIEACELLHLGCLIPLLDIIHWIGTRRGRKFINLDFFPKAWFGPEVGRMATSVLTFNPPVEREVPRVVMATTIVAVMKASYIGLNIIEEGSLLEKFLLLIPMDFGLMVLFLRELRRYVQISIVPREKRTPAQMRRHPHLACQILAAMTTGVLQKSREAVRTKDFMPRLAHTMMAKCRICKHQYLQYLIRPSDWYNSRNNKVCLSCLVTPIIESDDHAWLPEKNQIIDKLFGEDATQPPEDYPVPEATQQVCPVIENLFVWHPQPKEGEEEKWLEEMKERFWYGKYASEEFRKIHEQTKSWRTASSTALMVDSKNRYASSLGLSLDNSAKELQPRREHYLASRAWEGVYGDNLLHQGYKRSLDEATEWKDVVAELGLRRWA